MIVDFEKRFIIIEFFVYFWIVGNGLIFCDEKKKFEVMFCVFDVLKFEESGKCYDFCLFGVVNFCEVFDVGYVVY